MPITLMALLNVHAIKLAHLCVRSRIYFEIYFADTPRNILIPSLSLWGAIYCKKNLFPLRDGSSRGNCHPCFARRFRSVIHDEEDHAHPYAPRAGCMSLVPWAIACAPSLVNKRILYPLHAYTCVSRRGPICITPWSRGSWFHSSRCLSHSCGPNSLSKAFLSSRSWFFLEGPFILEVLIPLSRSLLRSCFP